MRTREGVLHWCRDPDGSEVQGVNVTDARGVNVNLTPLTSKRGALATDARSCSFWRYLKPGFETRSALDTSLDSADPGVGVTYAMAYFYYKK